MDKVGRAQLIFDPAEQRAAEEQDERRAAELEGCFGTVCQMLTV